MILIGKMLAAAAVIETGGLLCGAWSFTQRRRAIMLHRAALGLF
jgi:hypothetical protein